MLGDGIPTITVDGEANPHFWLDPSLVAGHYVPAIAAALTRLDPAGAATYAANAAAYTTQLRRSTRRTRPRSQTIPTANRKLVTFHDAFPYFAAHYGFELVGVILAERGPGAERRRSCAGLVDKVRAAGVKAVFARRSSTPSSPRRSPRRPASRPS